MQIGGCIMETGEIPADDMGVIVKREPKESSPTVSFEENGIDGIESPDIDRWSLGSFTIKNESPSYNEIDAATDISDTNIDEDVLQPIVTVSVIHKNENHSKKHTKHELHQIKKLQMKKQLKFHLESPATKKNHLQDEIYKQQNALIQKEERNKFFDTEKLSKMFSIIAPKREIIEPPQSTTPIKTNRENNLESLPNESIKNWLQRITQLQQNNRPTSSSINNNHNILEITPEINIKQHSLPLLTTSASTKLITDPKRKIQSASTNIIIPPQPSPRVVNYRDLPYMGEMTLDNCKPRRGRKPKKADICHLIYKNYGTIIPGNPQNEPNNLITTTNHNNNNNNNNNVNDVVYNNKYENVGKLCKNRKHEQQRNHNKIRVNIVRGNIEDQEITLFIGDDESDHLYESLSSNEHESDFEEIDSFDSDSESEGGAHIEQTITGDKFDNCQLPPTPEANVYSLSRLANRAGKHMQKLKKNWFLTKNDLTKSLGRITRKKTQTEIKINHLEISEPKLESSSVFYENAISLSNQTSTQSILDHEKLESSPQPRLRKSSDSNKSNSDSKIMHRNSALPSPDHTSAEKPSKKRQWSTKFKRSLSLSGEILATSAHHSPRHSLTPEKPQSTFYLYNIQIDKEPKTEDGNNTNNKPSLGPTLPIKSNSASPIIDSNKKSSWYTDNEIYQENKIKPAKSPSACWYAEINLYPNSPQPNNNSTRIETSADSSDSFSSSTTPTLKDENDSVSSYGKYYNSLNRQHLRIAEDPNENNENIHPQFLQDEPLYQFYTAEKVESGMRILRSSWNEDDDSDGYEQVGEISNQKQSRPSAMQLIRPSSPGQNRTLWCEVPQVISSNILNTLTLQQKKLQEAKFELITSEASYLISLNVLCNHFKDTIHRQHVLPDEDHTTLFGNIEPVKKCSENLLADLENCWQDNILLHGICDILRQHANDHFSVYITYCENQVNLEQTFKKLREQNGQFVDVLNKLESSPICQSLPLHSFLMLPMQRITRLPLLVDAILKRLTPDDDEYESCQSALAAVSKIVQQCNEAARNVEQRTEFKRIWNKLDFPSKQPSANYEHNKLIRSGEVTQLISRGDDVKLTFGKKFIKIPLHLFLFANLFIVAKRKGSEDLYSVIHYCPRNFVEIQTNEVLQLTTKDTTGKHLLFLTILENQDKKTIEMLLSCGTATDKQRWYEAFIPPISQNPDEILYESWDCPQVIVLHKYIPQQPDELPLDTGDVVNVTTKMTDGWYLGERIRDGRSGWFPGNHVTEVASPHVRAKNLKQRYRLLALSQNFVESQKKK